MTAFSLANKAFEDKLKDYNAIVDAKLASMANLPKECTRKLEEKISSLTLTAPFSTLLPL